MQEIRNVDKLYSLSDKPYNLSQNFGKKETQHGGKRS